MEDFAGREVTLEQPARRIVALAPHIVENLYSAGAGERLVGVVSYSNYPAQAAEIPEVGSYNAFSLEQIIALQPDLVVMWGSGNGMQSLDKLQALGIPVYVSELRQLADVPQSIRQAGPTGRHRRRQRDGSTAHRDGNKRTARALHWHNGHWACSTRYGMSPCKP